jgi:membrane associated rhomboid family serine protease
VHLAVNSLWMLAFGSVLARRFGAWRFLAFSALAAAAGAAANLWLYWGKIIVLMGASGAISGQMAGAVRLIFADPRGLAGLGRNDLAAVRPLSLAETFRNRQALVFLAVWAGLTVVTGALNVTPSSGDQTIAWEAHAGGFLAGLLLFGLFNRRR